MSTRYSATITRQWRDAEAMDMAGINFEYRLRRCELQQDFIHDAKAELALLLQ